MKESFIKINWVKKSDWKIWINLDIFLKIIKKLILDNVDFYI